MTTLTARGQIRATRVLLSLGANPNTRSRDSLTALILASSADHGRVDLARALLDAGADVNARDKDGKTSLMQAVVSADTVLAEALLTAGAFINAEDHYGDTALGTALSFKESEERYGNMPLMKAAQALSQREPING